VTRALAPRYWAAHLLALVLVGTAVALGAWQFRGWDARRAAEAVDLTRVAPEPVTDVMGPDDPFPGEAVGRPVVVEGTWLPEATLYVDGRQEGGEDGVWVVTPLSVGDPDDPALLVVRGQAPSPDRAPPAPTGEAELVAWLQPPDGATGLVDEDPTDDVIPQVRIADAVQRVDRDLYGAYGIVADGLDVEGSWPVGSAATNPGTEGLTLVEPGEGPEVGRFTAFRNFLYGVEWLLFGAFAAFIWWQYVRDRLRAEATAPEVTGATPPEGQDEAPDDRPVPSRS
jgi:surfeit locus 1 family protein